MFFSIIKKGKKDGLEPWGLRIGIHVGPVVAGVVGKKKYAYDIWGSTVNIASRMESNGVPGQVNISSSVYEIVKDKYDCSYRGKIHAKMSAKLICISEKLYSEYQAARYLNHF
jgi:class 3 adenylate cyclase